MQTHMLDGADIGLCRPFIFHTVVFLLGVSPHKQPLSNPAEIGEER